LLMALVLKHAAVGLVSQSDSKHTWEGSLEHEWNEWETESVSVLGKGLPSLVMQSGDSQETSTEHKNCRCPWRSSQGFLLGRIVCVQ
jgi:hypothetical protein